MSVDSAAFFEAKYYTVDEIRNLVGKSTSWVAREFRNYPGVIRSGKRRPGKRPYAILLIPECVLQRWIQEHTVPVPPEKGSLLPNLLAP
jgi:hypothetical protein